MFLDIVPFSEAPPSEHCTGPLDNSTRQHERRGRRRHGPGPGLAGCDSALRVRLLCFTTTTTITTIITIITIITVITIITIISSNHNININIIITMMMMMMMMMMMICRRRVSSLPRAGSLFALDRRSRQAVLGHLSPKQIDINTI